MTQQQIDYWKLLESQRANQAAEAENQRYHKASEALQSQVNAETQRHNVSMEAINRANLDIAARNAATNALNASTNARLAELTRQRDQEAARHNAALETIQSTHNANIIDLEQQKLSQNWEIAFEDRALRESIAAEDRAERRYEADLDASTKKETTFITQGGSLLTKAVVGGGLTAAAMGAASHVGASTTLGSGLGTAAAVTAGSIFLPITVGALIGLGVGKILSDNNVQYPRALNMNSEELKKGVNWYGTE